MGILVECVVVDVWVTSVSEVWSVVIYSICEESCALDNLHNSAKAVDVDCKMLMSGRCVSPDVNGSIGALEPNSLYLKPPVEVEVVSYDALALIR